MKSTRALIVDDEALARERVGTLLGEAAGVTVVGECSGGREADAKSLLAILALGARRGTPLRLRAEGSDAVEAVNALVALVSALQE